MGAYLRRSHRRRSADPDDEGGVASGRRRSVTSPSQVRMTIPLGRWIRLRSLNSSSLERLVARGRPRGSFEQGDRSG